MQILKISLFLKFQYNFKLSIPLKPFYFLKFQYLCFLKFLYLLIFCLYECLFQKFLLNSYNLFHFLFFNIFIFLISSSLIYFFNFFIFKVFFSFYISFFCTKKFICIEGRKEQYCNLFWLSFIFGKLINLFSSNWYSICKKSFKSKKNSEIKSEYLRNLRILNYSFFIYIITWILCTGFFLFFLLKASLYFILKGQTRGGAYSCLNVYINSLEIHISFLPS